KLEASETDVLGESVVDFNLLPTELICEIFYYLELKERSIAERVCSRWRSILLSRNCPVSDVAVVNLFEPEVWIDTIAKNRYTTVKGRFLHGFDGLRNAFMHISSVHTVKLWFYTKEFAKNCIDLVADLLDVKCMDIYPYENVHILPYLHERIPNLTTLNMRPHSNQFHSSGLQLPSFPVFTKLTTLILDNYSANGDFQLPSTIKSLEFSKREQTHYRFLLPKLANLPNLEYFTLSHADLSDTNDFRIFVRAVSSSQLPNLTILTLRMCKISPLNFQSDEASFITDVILFRALIVPGQLLMLRECKFVECDVVSIDVLKHLSMSAPMLRKLDILSCTMARRINVLVFVPSICARIPPELQITWRQDADTGSLDECYSKLINECQETLKGKNARFISKMFSTGEEGKEIVVTELDTMKSLIVRDYNNHQKYLTLGFIVGEHNSFED
ncbi:hypothetical protein Angca_000554, partial [Angiostrongylus cantonensis]